MSLIALFILQHSVLALPKIKQAICSAGFQSIERSTYLIITAFVLQVIEVPNLVHTMLIIEIFNIHGSIGLLKL